MARTSNASAALNINLKLQSDLKQAEAELQKIFDRIKAGTRKNAAESKKLTGDALDAEFALYEKHLKKVNDLRKRSDAKAFDSRISLIKQKAAEELKQVEKTEARRARIQAAWDKRRQTNNKKAAAQREKDETKAKEDGENRRARIQKAWDERRRRNNKAAKQKQIKDQEAADRKAANTYVTRWKRALDTVTRYISAAALVGLGLQGAKDIISDFLEIERVMYRVSAITGTTKKETDSLVTSVYEISKAYGIAAKDVANFTLSMVKLGKTQEEIKVLSESAANLSAILGEDMSQAGTLIVTTMNQFKLTTSEASRVAGTFLDVIQSSPQTVGELATVLQYIGTAANSVGFEVEELGKMIAFLSNQGIKSSKIGTGLRNVFLNLSKSGRNLKDVLQEMHEEGIRLTDALDQFGKRGAIVAYNLVRNWGEVMESFNDTLPTAIEQTAIALQASQAKMTEWTKTWEKLKDSVLDYFGFGENLTKEELSRLEVVNTVVDGLDKAELSLEEINKKVKKLIREDNLYDDEFFDAIFGEESKVGSRITTWNQFRGEWNTSNEEFLDAFHKYVAGMRDETNRNKAVNEVIDKSKDQYIRIANAVRTGALEFEDAVKAFENIEQKLAIDLDAAGFKESGEKAKKVISGYLNDIATVNVDGTAQEFADRIKYLKGKIATALKAFEGGAITSDEKDIALGRSEEMLEELCKKVAGTKFALLCDKKKAKKAAEKKSTEIKDAIAQVKRDIKEAVQDLETFDEKKFLGDESPTEAKQLAFKQFIPFSEFELDESRADMEKEEIIEEYRVYAKQFIKDVSDSVRQEVEEESLRITEKGAKEIDLKLTGIQALSGMISPENTEEENAALQAQIQNYRTDIKNIKEGIYKEIGDLIKTAEKLGVEIDEKDLSIDTLITKLLAGEVDGEEKDAKEKLKNTLQQVSNLLSEVSELYKGWADEMFNQLQERLDREKESIQNRYDFEKDQLRLAAENNLITQEQYGLRSIALEKDRLKKQNALEKKVFEAKKKHDIQMAIIDGLVQSAQAFITAYIAGGATPAAIPMAVLAAGLVVASTAVKVAAIQKREFTPVTFAEGGVVEGASHANGGVPFTVQGNSGYEMEGGEYLVKKDSVTAATLPLLDAINNDQRYSNKYFQYGGRLPDVPDAEEIRNQDSQQETIRAVITYKDLDAYERNKVSRGNNKKLLD